MAAGTGEPGGEVLRRLAEWGPSLLILDNLEHLLDQGASAWVASLLASLPDLTILATSRAFLGIAGEHEYALSPLPPDDAIALFVQHAGAIQPDFDVEEAAALAAVCEHLEGIPLAIELCAPWVRVLSLREIDERLQDRFDLLTTRRRDLPERHRSLSAALEGGCPTEPGLRQFFLQLSVFRGGFDREAAEAVCGGGDALGRIAELCERSLLLTVRGKQGETRYRVLETVRQYADELLGATERSLALRRHLAHFSARAHRETPLLAGSEAARWFERLDREVPNFRVAIDFGIEDTSQSRVQVRGLIDDLAWFLGMRGHAAPIAEWRSKLYERRQEQADEERAWIILDYSASVEAAAERKRLLEEALQLFKSLGNDGGMSMILERLARLSIERKDWDETRRLYSEAIRLREVAGDLRGAGYAMAVLAGALVEAGFSDEAYALRQRCREIAREFNDEGSIAVLDRADAWQFIERNQPERSIGLLENAAATFRRHGYTWQLMDTLLRLGEAFLQVENREQARVSWQEALPLAERCGDRNRHDQIRDYLETLAQPRTEANPDANPVIS